MLECARRSLVLGADEVDAGSTDDPADGPAGAGETDGSLLCSPAGKDDPGGDGPTEDGPTGEAEPGVDWPVRDELGASMPGSGDEACEPCTSIVAVTSIESCTSTAEGKPGGSTGNREMS